MSRTDNSYFYSSWRKMHTRCTDPTYHSYHRYGGRGITVCERWASYQNFKTDLYAAWWRGATLDRIDIDGNYEPLNVRWLPKGENTKTPKYDLTAIREMKASGLTQYQIAEEIGTDQAYVSRLLKRGISSGA